MKKVRRSYRRAEALEGGVQPSGAVIFLPVFGQPVAKRRRTRLEGVLAVFGEIRGGGPVWDVESGGTVCVLVADCQWPQSRARLKPETMTVIFEEFSPAHDFFDYRPRVTSRTERGSICSGWTLNRSSVHKCVRTEGTEYDLGQRAKARAKAGVDAQPNKSNYVSRRSHPRISFLCLRSLST